MQVDRLAQLDAGEYVLSSTARDDIKLQEHSDAGVGEAVGECAATVRFAGGCAVHRVQVYVPAVDNKFQEFLFDL